MFIWCDHFFMYETLCNLYIFNYYNCFHIMFFTLKDNHFLKRKLMKQLFLMEYKLFFTRRLLKYMKHPIEYLIFAKT